MVVRHVAEQYDNLNVYVYRQVDGNFRKNKKWSTQIDKAIHEIVPLDHTIRFDTQGSVQLWGYVKDFLNTDPHLVVGD